MSRFFKSFSTCIILSALGAPISGLNAAEEESVYVTCKEAAEAVGLTEPDEVRLYVEQCVIDMQRDGETPPPAMEEPVEADPSLPVTAE